MSRWTYVRGQVVISREEYYLEDFKYALERLSRLPKITGSEQDCYVFHNVLEEDYDYHLLVEKVYTDYPQTVNVILSFYGDLRDKSVADTKKEFVKLIYRLINRKWNIEEIDIRICDYKGSCTFGDEFVDKIYQ